MASSPRPYQGYPYTNPHVTDAPSIDSETANRWAHLPRKPLEIRNVVYVDMPREGGSEVTSNISGSTRPGRRKSDIDENPVIYIDVPESSSSSVAEPAEPQPEPEYVQDTIFYNPFDNRRIDQAKDAESGVSSDSDSTGSGASRPPPVRPTPPASLNVYSPGSSSGYSSLSSGLPHSLSKEAYVYGRLPTPDDGFPLSPIPVSEFPQPPPAYSETETPIRAPLTGPEAPGTVTEPPRTVVITPGTDRIPQGDASPIGLPNPHRKVVFCHHCGQRVHTLVIRQTGTATHVIALTLLCFAMIPLTVLVYCTDTCKDKNHYCPNCNKMIGYESPILCQEMTLTS